MQGIMDSLSPSSSSKDLKGKGEIEALRRQIDALKAENEKREQEARQSAVECEKREQETLRTQNQLLVATRKMEAISAGRRTCAVGWAVVTAIVVAVVAVLFMMLIAPPSLLHGPVAVVADSLVEKVKILEVPRLMVNETYFAMFPPERGVEMGLVGQRLRASEGLVAKHPVIIIPGFVSSGLQLWQAHPECTYKVRARMWGSMDMSRNILSDPKCWMIQMALNVTTGLDPEGVKLRPVEGIAGGIEFNEVYWLWNQIVDNLIAIGYDSSNLALLTYDWRLSCGRLEKRDRYFTKLRQTVELMHDHHGEKVVFYGHSMGSQMLQYFLKWVESDVGGKGGRQWVDTHIHASVSIAGANLGMPKSVSALVSGEMKDTSNLGVLDQLIEMIGVTSRYNRVKLFQTWYSLAQMLPKGGDAVWGAGTEGSAPDDIVDGFSCGGWLMKSTSQTPPEPDFDDKSVQEGNKMPNVSFSELLDFLSTTHPDMAPIVASMSFGYSEDVAPNNDLESKWYNGLEIELPNAPNMTYYHIYGQGKPTERAYAYQASEGEKLIRYLINTTYTKNGTWSYGVCFQSGDGTIPLTGLGYLGTKQWRTETHNPYGVRQVVREIPHKPHPIYPRGGETTGDHVDILGALAMNQDLLRIAGGQSLDDSFTSKIQEISDAIHARLQKSLTESAGDECSSERDCPVKEEQ